MRRKARAHTHTQGWRGSRTFKGTIDGSLALRLKESFVFLATLLVKSSRPIIRQTAVRRLRLKRARFKLISCLLLLLLQLFEHGFNPFWMGRDPSISIIPQPATKLLEIRRRWLVTISNCLRTIDRFDADGGIVRGILLRDDNENFNMGWREVWINRIPDICHILLKLFWSYWFIMVFKIRWNFNKGKA